MEGRKGKWLRSTMGVSATRKGVDGWIVWGAVIQRE